MKKILIGFVLAGFAGLLAIGCGSSSSGGSSSTETEMKTYDSCDAVTGEAVICGTAYAPDGTTPIAGAKVVLVTGSTSENVELKSLSNKAVIWDSGCFTQPTGVFICGGLRDDAIPTGSASFRIKGQGFNFTTQTGWTETGYTINFTYGSQIETGQTYSIPASQTTASSTDTTTKWLVVPGPFDGIQLLLSQIASCTLTGDASDPPDMTGSDDCESKGLYVLDSSEIADTFSAVSNLTTYTDIFINCSTDMSSYYEVLQAYVAQGGNMYFSDLADTGLTAAFPDNINFGTSSTSVGTITADVDYAALATYLGASTISIEFDLPVWQSIASVSSNVTSYISGDESSLGGPASAPITVGWKQNSAGCVFYTSYHIEGASTGADQEKALKYLVLNIGTVCQ